MVGIASLLTTAFLVTAGNMTSLSFLLAINAEIDKDDDKVDEFPEGMGVTTTTGIDLLALFIVLVEEESLRDMLTSRIRCKILLLLRRKL